MQNPALETIRLVELDRRSLSQADLTRFVGLGTHLLVDYHDCGRLPHDAAVLRQLLESSALAIGCTIVESVFHAFSPYGLSGVVIVAESHLAVHTWPEHRAACVDFFTCSDRMIPRPGLELLFDAFAASSATISVLPRGVPSLEV